MFYCLVLVYKLFIFITSQRVPAMDHGLYTVLFLLASSSYIIKTLFLKSLSWYFLLSSSNSAGFYNTKLKGCSIFYEQESSFISEMTFPQPVLWLTKHVPFMDKKFSESKLLRKKNWMSNNKNILSDEKKHDKLHGWCLRLFRLVWWDSET